MPSSKSKKISDEEAIEKLGPLAKVAGKGATELWKIFVRQYVGRGLAAVIMGVPIMWVASMKLYTHHFGYWCIPAAIVAYFYYDAIMLLVNPKYPALNDVIERVNEERDKKSTTEMTVYQKGS